MGTNSGNLIPTSVVDKNGVRTTRNKKATPASSAKWTKLPPVTLSPAAPNPDVEKLHGIVYGTVGGDYKRTGLEALHELDPEITQIATTMISSGTFPVKTLARRVIDLAAGQVLLMKKYKKSPEAFLGNIKEDLATAQTTGNLIAETGYDGNPIEIENATTRHISSLTRSGRMSKTQSTDPDYRRGVAIIALAGIDSLIGDTQEDAPEFIQWVSKRDDPARIVTLVKEWETLDVNELESIIASQDRTTAGLREGVL